MSDNTYILITGGAGYIGSHVNKLLNVKGYKTLVLDNLINGHREFVKWGEFILGDLRDKEMLRLCFKNFPIKAVMHFAAFAYVEESILNPNKYYENNLIGTLNILEVMREFKVNYMIFSSSCAVYGVPESIPITEEHPKNPINPYGRTKLMIELILKDYDTAYGIKHINLRYFNAAGADPDCEIGELHLPETHLIPIVLNTALGKLDYVKINGSDYDTPDGTCIRDFVHVMDLAEAHVLAMEHLTEWGYSDSFNLGIERGYSVKEVISSAERITNRKIEIAENKRREGDPPVLISSYEKARKVLNWEPKYRDLDSIIKTAWKWHKKLN